MPVAVVIENPFGIHPDLHLQLDPDLTVASILILLETQHSIECGRLLYKGRLLSANESLHRFLDATTSNRIITHVSTPTSLCTMFSSPSTPSSSSISPSITERMEPTVEAAPPRLQPIWGRVRRAINLQLLGKLAFFVFVLGHDGPSSRRCLLLCIASAIYIYHMVYQPPDNMDGNEFAELDAPARVPPPEYTASEYEHHTGTLELLERFIVGFFASLYPGWGP